MISYKLMILIILIAAIAGGFMYAGRDTPPSPQPVSKKIDIAPIHP